MHIRAFREDEDYDCFAQYCAEHGKLAPPRDLLPRAGLVVCQRGAQGGATEERKLAFVWIYKDPSSAMAWLGWLTTAYGLGPKAAREVCGFAVRMALDLARANGARVVFTETQSGGLRRLYERLGARVTHPTNVQLAWALS